MDAGTDRPGPVSRRERPAKPALSQETIVDAAMALLEADGLDGVSMRRVAQALDTGPASLYVYVKNRDELVALIMDRLAGEIALPVVEPGADWRSQLIDLLLAAIKELGRHPGMAAAMFATVPHGPNSLALTEVILKLLAQGGLSRQTQAWAVDLLALYVAAAGTEATISAEQGTAELRNGDVHAGIRDVFAGLPPERYPAITDLHRELTYGSAERRTRWSIDVLLNGILATEADSAP
jgi:AcrR family transcriptional regulator